MKYILVFFLFSIYIIYKYFKIFLFKVKKTSYYIFHIKQPVLKNYALKVAFLKIGLELI